MKVVLSFVYVVVCVGVCVTSTYEAEQEVCNQPEPSSHDTKEKTSYCSLQQREHKGNTETWETDNPIHYPTMKQNAQEDNLKTSFQSWKLEASEDGTAGVQGISSQQETTAAEAMQLSVSASQNTLQEEKLDKLKLHEEDSEVGSEARDGSVWTLRQEGHLENFISKGSISIVYFYRKSKREELAHFLTEYTKAAPDLIQYHIHLASVDCSEYPVMPYCGPDKVNHFAYGFRDGQEKIAFPLDTLFNANAIVASALHLALINTVPILQTATERRDLEARCKGRCNIVFAFLRTLGTLEHRMFLEVAYVNQDDFVFAITTYTAGTLGLTTLPSPEEDRESSVWAVHCRDKRIDEDCIVSQFRERMSTSLLSSFLHALHLPLWHDLSMPAGSSELVTPYDESGLPWLILVYDESCQSRVKDLAHHLAQLLHGSVALLTLNLDNASDVMLRKLWLKRHSLSPPSIAFLHPGQEEWASHLNDYDDPLTWVKEQLEVGRQDDDGEQGHIYLPSQPRDSFPTEELHLDDETVLGMVHDEAFVNIPLLAGAEAYHAVLASEVLPVIAFYLSWDPVSNALLQHLSLVVPALTGHKSRATVHRVNCFDWPYFCDEMGIHMYPVLRMHPRARQNITYDGQIHRDYILKTVLLLERKSPLELVNIREVEALMMLEKEVHPACSFVDAVTIAIFPSAEDAGVFKKASIGLHSTHLLGLHISALATDNLCGSSGGCVMVSKPSDRFQPRSVLTNDLDKPEAITNFIKHTSPMVLAELDPERYYSLVGEEAENAGMLQKYLIILFLPISTTQRGGGDSRMNSEMDVLVAEDDWGNKIGHLAAEMSEPRVSVFMAVMDPLAVELLAAYGLTSSTRSLVALVKDPDTTTLHVFPPTNTSQPAFRDWLIKLKSDQLPVTAELPKGDWRPQTEGFDFLKLFREDQDRDAEDHLVLEMEADLRSSPIHGKAVGASDEAKNFHEEL